MMAGALEESSVFGHGSCANCQSPFQKECSKVKRIIVSNNNRDDVDRCAGYYEENQEDIISISEALSVIFEIAPLTPNVRDGGGGGGEEESGGGESVTKKEIFRSGSRFRSSCGGNAEEDGDESDGNGYAVCIKCSEMLKELYRCFQNFTMVCKLDSEIGKILQSIEKDEGSRSQINDKNDSYARGEKGSCDDSPLNVRITVKTEPPESDGEEESGNDGEVNGDDDVDNSPTGSPEAPNSLPVTTDIIKISPPASDDEADTAGPLSPDAGLSENEEDEEGKEQEPRRSSRARRKPLKIIDDSDDDEQVPEPTTPEHKDKKEIPVDPKPKKAPVPTPVIKKVSFSLAGGRGFITQLKCPKCNKQFLHENTLVCHRRIIHGENIKLRPPPPLPQMKLSALGNADRVKALAEANGKTSVCPICRLEVPRTDIRYHLSSHTRSLSKPWLCTICGRNFNSQASLNDHAKVHVAGIPCKRCHKKIPTLEMLNHIRKCMAKPGQSQSVLDFSCKVCHTMFRTSDQLIEHRARVHAHFWKCKLCGIKFTQRDKMRKHMDTHKQKKSHKCKICDKTFNRIDVLRLHIKRFHRNNEGPPSVQRSVHLETGGDDFGNDFPASPDNFSSPMPSPTRTYAKDSPPVDRPRERRRYKKRGSSTTPADPLAIGDVDTITPIVENRFMCKGCAQTFCKASELDNHLMQEHADEESFTCKICNRKLQDSYCLKLHVKTHGEMKPLDCFYPGCGKIYRDKNTFFYHLKEKHGMDTKSIITKYPDVFRQKNKDYSTRYIRKRVGQVPTVAKRGKYPCEVCGKIFTQIYGLRSHIKLVHDKVKDFLCKYCGKAFARKSYFVLHERLHTSNESPYKCHLCNKGFRLPGNLRMHLQSTIHNPNKDFVCDVCGKGFNRNDNLRLHVKTVHLKIPVRKPKSESSDRYAHGGRNRIYIGDTFGTDSEDTSKANANATSTNSFADPVPGTSQSFFSQQNQHEQFSAFQRHPGMLSHMDSTSMDSSSHFSGDGVDSNKQSPASIDVDHHNTHQQQNQHLHSNVSMPILHHQQDGRSSADNGQQQFSQGDYTLRGFQYRL